METLLLGMQKRLEREVRNWRNWRLKKFGQFAKIGSNVLVTGLFVVQIRAEPFFDFGERLVLR